MNVSLVLIIIMGALFAAGVYAMLERSLTPRRVPPPGQGEARGGYSHKHPCGADKPMGATPCLPLSSWSKTKS